jgi:hypothetical protein
MELLEERAMILVYIESADPLPNLVNEIGKNPAFSTSDDLAVQSDDQAANARSVMLRRLNHDALMWEVDTDQCAMQRIRPFGRTRRT